MFRSITNTFYRLRRAISWFFFMYHNYEFDYVYLFQVIDKKLKDMQEFYSNKDRCCAISHLRIAVEIRKARRYLYGGMFSEFNILWKEFEEKYGDVSMKFKPYKGKPGFNELVGFNYSKCPTAEANTEANVKSKELWNRIDELHKQNTQKFFRYLEDNYEKWWD